MLNSTTVPTKCVCCTAGYCELMQRDMHPVRWDECKNKPHYFEMFLSEVGKKRWLQAPQLESCIHIGKQNGLIECPSCLGIVKLKTFTCDVHETCTLGKRLDGVACCTSCDDYSSTKWFRHFDVQEGTGTILKNIVGKFLGYYACESCNDLMQIMDERGPDWCRRNVDFILDTMEGNAKKLGFPFSRFVVKRLIRIAIRKAERE